MTNLHIVSYHISNADSRLFKRSAINMLLKARETMLAIEIILFKETIIS